MNRKPQYRTWMRLAQMAVFAVCLLALGGTAAAQPDVPQPFVPILDMMPAPAVAAPRVEQRQAEAPAVPTDTWAVEVAPGTDPDALAARLGHINLGRIANFENFYLFRIPLTGLRMEQLDGQTIESLQAEVARSVNGRVVELGAASLRTAPEIVWFEQQYARERETRLPSDPLFSQQWHLRNTGQSGGTAGADAKVYPVWQRGYTGAGTTIAIADDGLQHTHADLNANYVAGGSYDFNSNDSDPSPVGNNGHGTSAGGVAAARDNTTCGAGAAYRAGLSGLRILDGPMSDTLEANALSYQRNVNGIYNNSWGPPDNGVFMEAPGPLLRNAIADNVVNGRNGLGNIYVWAIGNGHNSNPQLRDYAGADGYATSRRVIGVAASDHNGAMSSYSEGSSAALVNAPSSGAGVGITTTDLMGANGYSSGDCTNGFGGTSSATPLVAGVIALMLQANPNLTVRDVQHILVNTADRNDPSNPNWRPNGSGRWFSEFHGFGRVDALEAVRRAEGWTSVPALSTYTGGVVTVGQTLFDGQPTNYRTSTHSVGTAIRYVEHVEVVFNATHTWRGDIRVILISPSGTSSLLMWERYNDSGDDYVNWVFTSSHFWGEDPNGNWTIYVSDAYSGDVGTFNNWQLRIYGTTTDPYNRVTNGAFGFTAGWSNGDAANMNWGVFSNPGPLSSDLSYLQTGGMAQFHLIPRTGISNSGGILQYTRTPVRSADVMQLTFQAQNTGSVRRRLTVIVHDISFSELRVCSFWLPANMPLSNFSMRFKSQTNWTDASVSFYASTATTNGSYRIDNVTLRTVRITTNPGTVCGDPNLPGLGSGSDSGNLLSNGDFSSAIGSPNGNWGVFGDPVNPPWYMSGGIFYMYRTGTINSAAVLQNSNQTINQGVRWELTVQLANSSPTIPYRVTILVRSEDFSDLAVCSFYLPGNATLQTYTMRGFTTLPWTTASTDAAVSIYMSSAAGSGWVHIDNASLRRRPTMAIIGTECYPPGSAPADMLPADIELPALLPTLVPTLYAPEGAPPEIPLLVVPADVESEGGTAEGSVSE
jgi:subtilisin-like proprotein convertase family protein